MHFQFGRHAVAVAASLIAAVPASAKDYVFATFVPPTHGIVVHALGPMAKEIAVSTDGRVNFVLKPGAQLFSPDVSIPSTGKGLADATTGVSAYTPSELPYFNLVNELQMFVKDSRSAVAAGIEMLLKDCPECQADYAKLGAVVLANYSTESVVFCGKPLRTLADLKGKKIRTTGGAGRWAKAMDATSVRMGIPEMPNAMERGQIDCVIGSMSWVKSYGLIDTVKGIIDYPMGTLPGANLVVMNRGVWKSLTPADRKAMMRHFSRATARATIDGYLKYDDDVRAEAAKKGISLVKGGKEFDDLMAKFLADERKAVITQAAKFRIKNPEKIVDTFLANVKKWDALVKDVGKDSTKFDQVLWDNLYSKVDPEKI